MVHGSCALRHLPCSRFGRVLLNDVLTCEAVSGAREGCAAAINFFIQIVPFLR
jgi:hypothetical protein